MNNPRPDRSPDHLDDAIEASCGALVTLEAILASAARVPVDVVSVQAQARRAIDSLRGVIADLRLLRSDDAAGPPAGFVVPGQGRPQRRPRDH